MQLKSPCKRCVRRKEDKNDCVKACNAIALYNKTSEIEYTEKGIVEMDKELDKLASEHADSIEDKPEVKEKEKCLNPICSGHAMVRRETGEVVNGYCRDCTRAGLSKKKKGLDMVTTKEVENKKKKKEIKNTIKLDLSKYPQIDKYLTEMSNSAMLPKEHIILSLIGTGIARSLVDKK